jgi:hypothetical protein
MTWALLRRKNMFDINSFGNISSGASEGPKLWSYGSSTDSLATVSASGYFDDVKFRIGLNDLIYVSASDGVEQLRVTSVNGATATTTTYVPSSGGAPSSATYIVQTPHPDLPNEVALSTLTNVTAASGDLLLVLDVSDSSNPKSVTAQSIADLGGGGGAGVVLPTVSGAMARFTDTIGTISSGPGDVTTDGSILLTANVIADGSVTAGAIITAEGSIRSGAPGGGFQGSFTAYPTSVSSGYFSMYALDASNGNFSSTLYNNPSIEANITYILPNPITNTEVNLAAYDGALAPTAGHLAVFGNNTGLLVDGGAVPTGSGTVNSGTANQIAYYASTSTSVSGLSTTARAAFATNSSGVPGWVALTDGQLVVGSTAGSPAAATLTAGTNITITNASNSITINSTASGGMTWANISGTTQAAAINTGYIVGNASATTITLPATAALGSVIAVQGKGAAGWVLTANTGQTIQVGQTATSSGGTVTSAANFDAIQVVCITANTTWAVSYVLSSGITTA